MSQQFIRAALETRLKTWADAKPLPIAFENAAFDPPATIYLRAYLLPNVTQMLDLQGRHRGYLGLLQVSVYLPIGVGPTAAQVLVGELDALFSTETPITGSSGLSVYITRPMSAAPAQQTDQRYVVPVSCEYRANTI